MRNVPLGGSGGAVTFLSQWHRCEEAQRIYHEKAADLAKAEHLMKEARLEAEAW